jgi:hypothetical protein
MGVDERVAKMPRGLQSGYWTPDRTSTTPDRDMLLRPNFDIPFDRQKKWHKEVVNMIRERGMGYSRGIMTQHELAAITDEEIRKRVEVAFKGARTKYKKQIDEQAKPDIEAAIKRRAERKRRVRFSDHTLTMRNSYSFYRKQRLEQVNVRKWSTMNLLRRNITGVSKRNTSHQNIHSMNVSKNN